MTRALRPGLVVTLAAATVFALSYGCSSFAPNTVFACDEAQQCPEPLVCIDSWCEAATSTGGGTGETGGGAGETGGGAGGGGVDNSCVPDSQPEDDGIYVDPNAPENPFFPPDGTPERPYRDLDEAIKMMPDQVIYIAPGKLEMAALEPAGRTPRIEGGWEVSSANSWTKDCSSDARPTLVFSGTVGLTLGPDTKPIELRDLVITQTDVADAGPEVGGSFGPSWTSCG